MDKTLQKGEDKIQQICDILRLETLQPAKEEAARIIEEAKTRAEQMIAEARKEIAKQHAAVKAQIEQERNVFESSLEQSGKMALEKLRQSIETQLLSEDLFEEVESKTSSPETVAKIINALVEAIEKEGINSDLKAVIPHTMTVDQLTQYLTAKTLKRLRHDKITVGDIKGGVQLKLMDKRITLDMTDKTLKALLLDYIGNAFRERLFVEA